MNLSLVVVGLIALAVAPVIATDDLADGLQALEQKIEAKIAAEKAAKEKAAKEAETRQKDAALRWEKYRKVRHPRLFLTPERVAAIRKGIAVKGSHYQLAYEPIRERYSGDLGRDWVSQQARSGKRWPARIIKELAFLSAIAEDPKEQRRYAEAAARFTPDAGAFLSLHFTGNLGTPVGLQAIALAYDWGHNQYTDKERLKFEGVLESCMQSYGGSAAMSDEAMAKLAIGEGSAGYNHNGVKAGGEVLLRLAIGDDAVSPKFAGLLTKLTMYMKGVGGELGAHREGLAYTEYPMAFAMPAAIAADDLGYPEPLNAAKAHAFWQLNMYAQTFMTSFDRKFIQYGVDHQSNCNEGFPSTVFRVCPPNSLPFYRWFYDRHMGRLCKAKEDELRFDMHARGTPFALLFYPDDVTSADPTPTMPKAVVDRKHGYCFFRNRWKDEDDIQVALIAGNPEGGGGWGTYEQLSLRLMAYDTRFFGGPGKSAVGLIGVPSPDLTTLMVDGALPKGGVATAAPATRNGRLVSFETDPTGGYAIVDKDQSGPLAGIENATRHLLVRFSPADKGTAILSTLDDIESAKSHIYTWQGNLGAETMEPPAPAKPAAGKAAETPPSFDDDATSAKTSAKGKADTSSEVAGDAEEAQSQALTSDDGIISSQGAEGGRPFFLLKGRRGYVKAWILHPADAVIKTGDPIQVTTQGANAKIWVAMYVGSGDPVTAKIAGADMDTSLTLDGSTVTFDGKRIRCE